MNYQALTNQAAELAQTGQYPALEIICQKILKKKPKHFNALQLLGLAQSHTGQLKEAIRNLKRARKLDHHHVSVRVNLANACLDTGQIEDAVKFSREAIKLDSSIYAAQLALGNSLQLAKSYEESEQAYAQALKLQPDSPEVIDNLGECYKKQGKLSQAVNMFLQANDTNPLLSKVYIHLFQSLMLMQITDDALKVANAGLDCGTLSAAESYELLIGKAKITWLTGHLQETHEALMLTRQIIGPNKKPYTNLANLQAYDSCLRNLLKQREEHAELYQGEAEKAIFFVAESHALAPSEVLVNYQGTVHRILSTLITGCKIWHLTQENPNEYQAGLDCFMSAIPPQSTVVLGFGEIDCRATEGILKACRDKNLDYHLTIDSMIKQYLEYVLSLTKADQHRIIIYGVPAPNIKLIPTIDENQQTELRDLIRLFNQTLKQNCGTEGLEYLDVYALTVDDEGSSNQQFHFDAHHLHPKVFPMLFDSL